MRDRDEAPFNRYSLRQWAANMTGKSFTIAKDARAPRVCHQGTSPTSTHGHVPMPLTAAQGGTPTRTQRRAQGERAITPQRLGLEGTATYLGVSP
jgi:hypothetical protein